MNASQLLKPTRGELYMKADTKDFYLLEDFEFVGNNIKLHLLDVVTQEKMEQELTAFSFMTNFYNAKNLSKDFHLNNF